MLVYSLANILPTIDRNLEIKIEIEIRKLTTENGADEREAILSEMFVLIRDQSCFVTLVIHHSEVFSKTVVKNLVKSSTEITKFSFS